MPFALLYRALGFRPLATGSGGLATLAVDPTTFALSGATPDALTLPVGQRMFEASLPNCALITDSLCLACLLIGDRVENIWIDAPAGCVLAPGGTHGNIPCYGWGHWTTRQGNASVTWEKVAYQRKQAEQTVWLTGGGGVHNHSRHSVVGSGSVAHRTRSRSPVSACCAFPTGGRRAVPGWTTDH